MRVSIGLSSGGESLTWAGKVAPPMPTMPASRNRSFISSGVRLSGSPFGKASSQASSPSGLMTTEGRALPDGCGRGSTATTSPEVDACTGTETNPLALPITWPFLTCSPSSTQTSAGAPICCESGIVNSSGSGTSSTGLVAVHCLLSAGCSPPGNVFSLPIAIDQAALSALRNGIVVSVKLLPSG